MYKYISFLKQATFLKHSFAMKSDFRDIKGKRNYFGFILNSFLSRYGDIMTVYLGSRCTIMLNSYDVIKEAFVKHGNVLSGRPQDLFFIEQITEGLRRRCSEYIATVHASGFQSLEVNIIMTSYPAGSSGISDYFTV